MDYEGNVHFLCCVALQKRLVTEGSEISIVNSNNDWLNPSQIQLLWKHQNLTSNEQDRISIKLVGYREDNTQVCIVVL
jgi:hypothetical protein